jgi:hypothetical protein
MMSNIVHRTGEHRSFSCIGMATTSILFLVATVIGLFSPMTVYGAQSQAKEVPGDTSLMKGTVDVHSTTTQTDTRFDLTNISGNPIDSLSIGVLYTRPDGFMPQDSAACSTAVLSFTPSDNVKDPTSSCPWFTCNYLTWSPQGAGECSSVGMATEQAKGPVMATFRSLPSSVTTANTYMVINFGQASLPAGAHFQIDGCIYYDNWPHFSIQQDSLVVFSGNTLLWGAQPSGMDLQSFLKVSSLPASASSGW